MKKNIAYRNLLILLICLCSVDSAQADGHGRGVGGFFAGLGVGAALGATTYPAPYYAYDPYYPPYWGYPRYGRYYPYDYDVYYQDGRHNYYPDRPKN